jgi:hypothetical protein
MVVMYFELISSVAMAAGLLILTIDHTDRDSKGQVSM